MGNEGLEVLAANVAFVAGDEPDDILLRFGDRGMITEMEKVFFSSEPNGLGHTYASLIRGPGGRTDLQDVIDLLHKQPETKRALVSFMADPGKKVPCISAVQFLVRDGALQLIYFARGQDAFRKFYADALCLVAMGRTVAKAVGVKLGAVRGFIGSAHVYEQDLAAIRQMLASAGAPAEAVRNQEPTL